MSTRIFAAGTVVCSLMATLMAADTQPAPPESIPKTWVQYHAHEAFSFWGPADLKEKKVQGIDSYVGHWDSPTMTVTFDWGLYSGKLEGDGYTYEDVTVDGHAAVLSTSKKVVGLYVGDVHNKGVKLSLRVACSETEIKDARALLLSTTFGKSEDRTGR
jgi:hypothetical protein